MPIFEPGPFLGSQGETAYQISRSLRFRSSASAYLSRTPASAGNRQTWTWSGWVKRGLLTVAANSLYMFDASASGIVENPIAFNSSDNIELWAWNGTGYDYRLVTSAVFRDPSAWYHLVVATDTTQATASNRVKIYINGVLQSLSITTYPSLNYNTAFNSTNAHNIARSVATSARFFDGYLADINFIDGQALTPSSFGETDATTGVWKPKAYTGGSYGTNGFYLKFADNSGATATTIGKDSSGNGNNWTPNNIAVAAGYTCDSMVDTPTPYDNGVNGAGNYPTFNPLTKVNGTAFATLSNGNLQTTTGNNVSTSTMPIPTTGKWYMEFELTTAAYPEFAIANLSFSGAGTNSNGFGFYNGTWFANGTATGTSSAWPSASGHICLVAVDVDNNKLWMGVNKSGTVTWAGGGDPGAGTTPTWSASGGGGAFTTTFNAQNFIWPCCASGGGGDIWNANFGQRGFSTTVPSGFKALNTQNLPTPTIANGAAHMAATIWSGNSGTQNISNAVGSFSFQPDWIWTKCRNVSRSHRLIDAVRGVSKQLYSDYVAVAEATPTSITAFLSGGFTTYNDPTDAYNVTGETYVSWQWKAGNGTVSNASGSIPSTVSANTTAGFSVVTYTGSSTTGTVGHGLGVAPNMILVKTRNAVADWYVYHSSVGTNKYLYLNLTNATISASGYFDTVDSSKFGGTSAAGIISTNNFVAYCFAAVAGYSSFGSYVGNGSTDGTFVYTGFQPRYLLVKRTDTTSDWVIIDAARDTYNVTDKALFAELSNVESTGWAVDFLSNGFKLRFTGANMNASGGTYVYACFASNPFKYSLAR